MSNIITYQSADDILSSLHPFGYYQIAIKHHIEDVFHNISRTALLQMLYFCKEARCETKELAATNHLSATVQILISPTK